MYPIVATIVTLTNMCGVVSMDTHGVRAADVPPTSGGCAADEVNLVKNPGFEDSDATVWKLGKYMTVEEGIGRNGSRGVRWKSGDARCSTSYLSQGGMPAEPGRIYSYEGWIKLGAGLTNGPIYFNMGCRTREGKSLAHVEGRPLIRQPQLKGKGWVKVSGATARAPVGTAFVSISCHPPRNCGALGCARCGRCRRPSTGAGTARDRTSTNSASPRPRNSGP